MRHISAKNRRRARKFQLTHLLRGATTGLNFRGFRMTFQLTHLLRGATSPVPSPQRSRRFQLTHLLRGATRTTARRHYRPRFQLTHLLRGATLTSFSSSSSRSFQLTHLLRGATLDQFLHHAVAADFNSRTSCEVRPVRIRYLVIPAHFNSRTSCEVRRNPTCVIYPADAISTHAPLARCDFTTMSPYFAFFHFNSRTSCEVRRKCGSFPAGLIKFQLTHLLRGATDTVKICRI